MPGQPGYATAGAGTQHPVKAKSQRQADAPGAGKLNKETAVHMLIAFVILAALAFVPALWIIAMANAWTTRVSSTVLVLQAAGIALVFAFVGTLIFGGSWALLAPLFGG